MLFRRGHEILRAIIAWCVSFFLYLPPRFVVKKDIIEQMVRRRPERAKRAILYFHGNATSAQDVVWLGLARGFDDVAVFAAEYPGYGNNLPVPKTEAEMFSAAELAWRLVIEDGFSPDQITIWGQSLGCAPAVYIASTRTCNGVVLQAAFVSVFTVVNWRLGRLMRWLELDLFDNAKRLRGVKCPVAFVHATDDELISYRHNVFVNMAEVPAEHPTRLWNITGGHNARATGEDIASILTWLWNDRK